MTDCSLPTKAVILAALSLGGPAIPAVAADPGAGKAVFTSQCGICHSVQSGRNMVGPSLFGIVRRKTASIPGLRYSPANQNANFVWDEAALDKYLQAPVTMMPGTTMGYAGLKDETQRSNLVAYIATLK